LAVLHLLHTPTTGTAGDAGGAVNATAADSCLRLPHFICRVLLHNLKPQVLQEMLDMLRDHENNHHSARLEWIVIYLIMVEVVVGLLEVLGLFGLVGNH
jgi:hypothetical protein